MSCESSIPELISSDKRLWNAEASTSIQTSKVYVVHIISPFELLLTLKNPVRRRQTLLRWFSNDSCEWSCCSSRLTIFLERCRGVCICISFSEVDLKCWFFAESQLPWILKMSAAIEQRRAEHFKQQSNLLTREVNTLHPPLLKDPNTIQSWGRHELIQRGWRLGSIVNTKSWYRDSLQSSRGGDCIWSCVSLLLPCRKMLFGWMRQSSRYQNGFCAPRNLTVFLFLPSFL